MRVGNNADEMAIVAFQLSGHYSPRISPLFRTGGCAFGEQSLVITLPQKLFTP
jgi:hypothetical protein